MDAMDILGGLLGSRSSKSGGGGLGGGILKDLINAGMRGGAAAQQPRQPQPRQPQPHQPQPSGGRAPNDRPGSLDDRARELEDMLGVARGRTGSAAQPTPQPQQLPPAAQPRYQQPPPPTRPRYQQPPASVQPSGFPTNVGAQPAPDRGHNAGLTQNDEALVLVRAMINAAKADGSVSQEEQQAIIHKLANPTQETIDFLRQEFSAPLNVRDFAWSVPLGMEQQVYTMSLAAINLDTNPEAAYLRDLAHGLRLDAQFCNELHQRYGAPTIF